MAQRGKKAVSKIFNIGINISKWVKYALNPIVWYVLLFLLLIFFLAGVISLFTILPGAVTGFFSNLIDDIVKADDETQYNIKDEDVLELAQYLDSMGYDIENYGFVEKKEDVKRENNTQDGEYYIDNKPSKGKIISIKSKYLEAYLGEEAKMFKLASKEYKYVSFFEEYYLNKAIYNVTQNIKVGDTTDRYLMAAILKSANENLKTFYLYYILGRDITKYDKQTQEKYFAGKSQSEQESLIDVLDEIKEEYNKLVIENKDRRIGARNACIRGNCIRRAK